VGAAGGGPAMIQFRLMPAMAKSSMVSDVEMLKGDAWLWILQGMGQL
jgi:hypothetical protein